MTTTVSGAVAVKEKSDQLVMWLRGQQGELAMAAASHLKPSTIVRVAQGALRKDDKLMAAAIANPLSLLHCLLDAARLGHEPGTDQYYLVPFGQEVTGIEGYKGVIERMFRAGAVSAVVAEVVYQRDAYHRQGATLPPIHEFDEFADPADRGPLRGAYAYAVMLDGRYSKIIAMGRAEIMKHKAASRGSSRDDSPWQRWEESMWKKCPLRGLEPYVPTSSEWLAARAQAAMTAQPVHGNGLAGRLPVPPQPVPEPVVDAEIVDEPVPQEHPEPPPARQGNTPRAGKVLAAKLDAAIRKLPLGTPEDTAELLNWLAGGTYTGTKTQAEAALKFLDGHLQDAQGDVQNAAEAVWEQYRAAVAQDAAEGTQDEAGGDGG